MKKVFLSLVLASSFLWGSAQYNNLTLYYSTGKLEDAKKEIDKLITEPKTQDKPETYFWKFAVYAGLYADSSTSTKYPDAGKEALAALNTYTEKDPSLKKLKEDGTSSLHNLYAAAFNQGIDLYQKKQYDPSLDKLLFTGQVLDYVSAHNLKETGDYKQDTTLLLYTGIVAELGGKKDEAMKYYKELADWKLKDTSYQSLYRSILYYDTEKKDEKSFQKYLAIVKEIYPANADLWNQYEMNYKTTTSSVTELIAKYKDEDSKGTLNEDGYVNYAQTFASPDKQGDLDSAQKVDVSLAAADAFGKAYNLNNKEGLYAYNAGLLNFNVWRDLDDRFFNYAGESSEYKAKRAEILKQQQDYFAKASEWLEKAYTTLKAKTDRDKKDDNVLNRTVTMLSNLFQWKRDKSKGNDKDYDAYDAKFKLYDAEVGKY